MRSALTTVVCAMRAFSVPRVAAISASSTARVRSISRRRVSSSLAMRASVTTRSCWMRAFSMNSRADLGFLDRAAALDLLLSHLAFGGDAGGVDRALVGDARLLDFLARADLLFLDRLGALDFALAGFALGGDARFGDGLLVGDARPLDRSRGRRSAPARLRCRARPVRAPVRRAAWARRNSISRSCSSRAVSLSRSMSSACRSASRLRARIWIIESCSMSLRSLRRASMSGSAGSGLRRRSGSTG